MLDESNTKILEKSPGKLQESSKRKRKVSGRYQKQFGKKGK